MRHVITAGSTSWDGSLALEDTDEWWLRRASVVGNHLNSPAKKKIADFFMTGGVVVEEISYTSKTTLSEKSHIPFVPEKHPKFPRRLLQSRQSISNPS